MRRSSWFFSLCMAALLWFSAAVPAAACPMCKLANETDNRLPRAYMYSILFMLGMPATLLASFGVGFYRLSRKAGQTPQDPFADEIGEVNEFGDEEF